MRISRAPPSRSSVVTCFRRSGAAARRDSFSCTSSLSVIGQLFPLSLVGVGDESHPAQLHALRLGHYVRKHLVARLAVGADMQLRLWVASRGLLQLCRDLPTIERLIVPEIAALAVDGEGDGVRLFAIDRGLRPRQIDLDGMRE